MFSDSVILSNKCKQDTRFVRSLQRCFTAVLRNLPTLHRVIYEDFEDCCRNFENAKGSKLRKKLDQLEKGENLFVAIGLAQLLENYCLVSLESQYCDHFPIQVWKRINLAKVELENWAENGWTWSENPLKLSGIGTPQKIITEVLRTGIYTPYVPIGSIRKNLDKVNNLEEILANAGTNKLEDIPLFDEENQRILELAKNLLITGADDQALQRVEKKLKKAALQLKKCWDERMTQTLLEKATFKAFGEIHVNEDLVELREKMLNLLEYVIKALPPRDSELFDQNDCIEGFLHWNTFWKSSLAVDEDPLKNVHLFYQNWVKISDGQYPEFQDLWEIVMIRSTSEAICETVGSMMNQHSGRNRHLDPTYLSMGLVLRVNFFCRVGL